jgi:hypothetical protein
LQALLDVGDTQAAYGFAWTSAPTFLRRRYPAAAILMLIRHNGVTSRGVVDRI